MVETLALLNFLTKTLQKLEIKFFPNEGRRMRSTKDNKLLDDGMLGVAPNSPEWSSFQQRRIDDMAIEWLDKSHRLC